MLIFNIEKYCLQFKNLVQFKNEIERKPFSTMYFDSVYRIDFVFRYIRYIQLKHKSISKSIDHTLPKKKNSDMKQKCGCIKIGPPID